MSQKPATTQYGHMGLLPEGALVDDHVQGICGCKPPVALRAYGDDQFRLIDVGQVLGFDFDDVVAESSLTRNKGGERSEKDFAFRTWK